MMSKEINKKLISLTLSISIAAASLPIFAVPAMAALGGGDGTAASPYKISTVAELKEFRDNVNSGTDYDGTYFELTNNIDLADESWTPIGVYVEDESVNLGNPFKGTFNGGGYTISGLKINSQNNAGLFGYLYDADVSYIAVKGAVQGNQNAGGIAGYSRNSRITYCVNYCTVTGNADNTGGIAGYIHKIDDDIEASVTCCYNKGVIIGAGDTGGIVGESLNGGIIENCYNVSTVTGTEMNTGGIVGYENGQSTVLRCYNYANIKGASSTGEIIGRRAYDAKTDYCYYLEGGESKAIGNVSDTARIRERTADEFADAENTERNFIDWDFDTIWIMSEALKRPVLRNSIPEPYLTVHYILQKSDGVWENADTKREYYETAEVLVTDKVFENYTLTGYSTGEYKTEAEREITYPGSNISLNTEITELYLYYTLDTQKLVFYSDSAGAEIDSTENIILGASLAQYADKTLAEKQGYTFAGWSYEKNQNYYKTKSGEVNENLIDLTNLTMPGGTLNAYPVWVRDRLNVKLTLDDDAEMDISQSSDFNVDIDEKLQMNKMNAASQDGYTLDGWYTEDGVKWNVDYGVTPEYCDKNDDGTPIIQTEADRKYKYYTVTLTANWTPKTVTIKYDKGKQGTAETTDDYVDFGGEVILADEPAHDSAYSFTGWKDRNGKVYSAKGVLEFTDWSLAENDIITLTAQYERIPDGSIVFDTDGGTAVETVTDIVGTTVDLTDKTTEKTGHTFEGWYDGETQVTSFQIENTTKTIKAKWTANSYTITFDTNGGDEIAAITQNYGTDITAPANPTKTHYDFAGWNIEIPKTMPARNTTISARWTPKEYTITFDTGGGSEIAKIKGVYGSKVDAPKNPARDGFTFFGWDSEIPEYMPDTNPTITAKWKQNQTAPDAPEIHATAATFISLFQKIGEEYRIDGGEWKKSDGDFMIFDGLKPNTEYEFTARKPGDDDKMPSEISAPTKAKTLKLPQNPPNAPDASAQSATTVVVNPAYNGIEYRIADGEWVKPNEQGTVIFGGLTPSTEYDVTARMAETETQYASNPSEPTRVKTMSDAPVDIYYIKQQTDGMWKNAGIEDETLRELKSYKADKTFDHYTLTGYSVDEYKEEAERSAAKKDDTITFDVEVKSLYLYYTLDTYDLIFYRDIEGTEKETTKSVFYGAPLLEYSAATPASKEGYTFAAWSQEKGQDWYRQKNGTQNDTVISWYELTMPAESFSVYPVWVKDRVKIHLNLDADAEMDNSQSLDFAVDIGEKIRMDKLNTATLEGYTLEGWYTADSVKWNAEDGVTPEYCDKNEENEPDLSTDELRKYNYYTMTLTAKWEENPTASPTAAPTAAPTVTPRRSGGGGYKPTATPTPTPTLKPKPEAKLIEKDPYVAGYEDGSFRPNNPIKRAELATMLARLMTNKFDGYTSAFSDAKGIWSEKYIGYLEDYNILVGYEDGSFRPENDITRAEMAVMMAKLNEYDLTASVSRTDIDFSDIDESYIKWAAASAIKQLTEAGIISGYEDGTFRPASSITRAEAVAIINRTIKDMEVEEITVTPNDVTDSHWAYKDILFAMNKRRNK